MNEGQALPGALTFLLFAAVTFIVLRLVLDRLARASKPFLAGPLLEVFGAFSGAYFYRLGMHTFFIWHLILFGLVILSWHVKSRVDEAKLAKISAAGDKLQSQVVQDYTMT